jgi:hypothetical protein
LGSTAPSYAFSSAAHNNSYLSCMFAEYAYDLNMRL